VPQHEFIFPSQNATLRLNISTRGHQTTLCSRSKHIIAILPTPTLLKIIIAPIKVSFSIIIVPRIVFVLVEDVVLGLRIEVLAFFRVAVTAFLVVVVVVLDDVSIGLILVVLIKARESIQRGLLGQAEFPLFSGSAIGTTGAVWVVPDRFVEIFGEEAWFWWRVLAKKPHQAEVD
jgi:hypothetical protein